MSVSPDDARLSLKELFFGGRLGEGSDGGSLPAQRPDRFLWGHGDRPRWALGRKAPAWKASPRRPSPAQHTAAWPWDRCAQGPARGPADGEPRLCHSAAFLTLPGPSSALQRPGNISVWREARQETPVSGRPRTDPLCPGWSCTPDSGWDTAGQDWNWGRKCPVCPRISVRGVARV